MRYFWLFLSLFIITFPPMADARIKLVALPEREATLVRLDNPNATLLAEQRTLTLQAGTNQIDFSWQGVQIQMDSIQLTVLEQQQPVTILNNSYPPNANALVWEIASPVAQTIKVRIHYLLKNIDRLFTYNATLNKTETALDLQSLVVLRNFSGESLNNARFQIAEDSAFNSSINHEETKRVQFFQALQLDVSKHFIFDAGTMAWDAKLQDNNVGIPVFFYLENSKKNQLGNQSLREGKLRLFGEDSQKSTLFLGEDNVAYTPINQMMKIKIGESRDVVVTQKKMQERRLNERRNQKGATVLYDLESEMQIVVENFKNQAAAITIREPMPEEWVMKKNSHAFKKEHAELITFDLPLAPNEKVTLNYTYQQKNIRD